MLNLLYFLIEMKGGVNLNRYYKREDCMVGVCSDGTEFLFDLDDFEKVSSWNWTHHHDGIDGNKGKVRRSLAKVVLDMTNTNMPVLRKKKVFDYRKSNLYSSNTYIDKGEYYEVKTITGKGFYIDKEDYKKVEKYRWFINTQGYPEAISNKKHIRLHRYILGMQEEFSYDRVVDHINKNPCDNRKSNLRIVSQAVNARNRSISKRNTSGVPGASWSKEANAWRVSRTIDGVKYNIGMFNAIEEAEREIERFERCFSRGEKFISRSTYVKKVSSSGHKYIYNHKPSGFTVAVKKDGKNHYLGLYQNIEDALKTRDKFLGTIDRK